MRKSYRNALIAVTVVLLLAAPLVVLFTAPMSYVGLIEHVTQRATGLQLQLSGLGVDLFPPRITARGLSVSNPNGGYRQPLLSLQQAELSIDRRRLLAGAPAWWSAQVSGVQIRSGIDRDGEDIWHTPSDNSPAAEQHQSSSAGGPALAFEKLEVTDLTFYRLSGDSEDALQVTHLGVDRQPDTRMQVTLDARYRDQPVIASGTLSLPRADTRGTMNFHARAFGSELQLTGELAAAPEPSGHLEVSADADDLSLLGLLLGQDLHGFAPVHLKLNLAQAQRDRWTLDARGTLAGRNVAVNAGLRNAGDTWSLDRFRANVGDSDVSGNGSLNTADKRLTAAFVSRRFDVAGVTFAQSGATAASPPSADKAAPLIPAFDLDPVLAWHIDAELRMAELSYGEYRVEGLQINADTTSGALNVKSDIERLSAAGGEGPALQLTAPLKLSATVKPLPENKAAAGTLVAHVSTRGIEGELETLLPAEAQTEVKGRVQVTLDDFSALRGIDTQALQKFLPVTASLQARASGRTLHLTSLKLDLNGNTLEGPLTIDATTTPVSLSGDIHAQRIDLNRITAAPAQNPAAAPDTGKVFDTRSIDWSWLNAARLDLGIDVQRLDFNRTSLHNLQTKVSLKDAGLQIKPFAVDLSTGRIQGHLNILRTRTGADVDTRLDITSLVPADLGQSDESLIEGGETDAILDLKTHGDTPHALAGNLDGEIALEMKHARVRNDIFERLGSDILMQTLNLINPFAKRETHTELECAAARFNAVDGVLTSPNEIAVVSSKMLIRGGGSIDLGRERLQIDLVPTARKGLGISPADLAKFVRLGGSLSDPQPVADPQGILKSGATIGAAIATGGVSLLAQGLYNKVTNLKTRCSSIYEQAASTAGGDDPQSGAANPIPRIDNTP